MEFTAKEFGASFKAFREQMASQGPVEDPVFVRPLRDHFQSEPAMLPVVTQRFETYDHPQKWGAVYLLAALAVLAVTGADAGAEKAIAVLDGKSGVANWVAFSPDGKILAGGFEKAVKFWTVADRKVMRAIDGLDYVMNVVFSPDGSKIATATLHSGDVKTWDVQTGKEQHTLNSGKNPVFGLAWSPCGKLLASSNMDGDIRIWDAATGNAAHRLRLSKRESGLSLAFSPDGSTLVAGTDDTVRLWQVTTWKPLSPLPYRGKATSVTFNKTGRLMATSGSDQEVRIWDTKTWQEKVRLTSKGQTRAVGISPDGTKVVAAYYEGPMKVWNLTTKQPVRALEGHTEVVVGIAFSPDGKLLASAGHDGTVRLWNMKESQ